MLNVCGEKVDQASIIEVMSGAESSWGIGRLVDYACAESNLLIQGKYLHLMGIINIY